LCQPLANGDIFTLIATRITNTPSLILYTLTRQSNTIPILRCTNFCTAPLPFSFPVVSTCLTNHMHLISSRSLWAIGPLCSWLGGVVRVIIGLFMFIKFVKQTSCRKKKIQAYSKIEVRVRPGTTKWLHLLLIRLYIYYIFLLSSCGISAISN
jgi:hypothetical protein